jgi:GT2 family glycosyltransferase
MELSIVIPVLNNYPYTKNCISKLLCLDPSKFQVIVVDNASSDETEKELTKIEASNFTYIRNDVNTGFGAAVNLGYSRSFGKNVMFLNNDVKFKDNYISWFNDFVSFMEKNANALVGPTGGFVDPKKDFAFVYETNSSNKQVNYMSGWCLTSSRETWEKLTLDGQIGPFDSKTFFVYFEDTDLGFRASERSFPFVFCDVPMVHIGKQTSKKLNLSKMFLDSKEKFLKKWKH